MLQSFTARLDGHFVACAGLAAAAAVGGMAQRSQASIVYSGQVNLPVPNDFYGVYLNLVNGATGSSSGSTPGWDINPYFGGIYMFQPSTTNFVDDANFEIVNLAPGTVIDGSSGFQTFGDMDNFSAGQAGLFGLHFGEGANTYFGWVRIIKGGSTPDAGTIVDWGYETDAGVGIPAGAVPAPGSLALLALGAAAAGRRSRK